MVPNDIFIILIGGATGVGKTTLARKLLSKLPKTVVLEEFDLLREVVRENTINNILTIRQYLKNNGLCGIAEEFIGFESLFDIDLLNSSTTILNYYEITRQCILLIPSLLRVMERLSNKNTCGIIEGSNLNLEALLNDNKFIDYIQNITYKLYYINLYADNSDWHYKKIINRLSTSTKLHIKNFNNICNTNKKSYEFINQLFQNKKYRQTLSNIDIYNFNVSNDADGKQIYMKVIEIIQTHISNPAIS